MSKFSTYRNVLSLVAAVCCTNTLETLLLRRQRKMEIEHIQQMMKEGGAMLIKIALIALLLWLMLWTVDRTVLTLNHYVKAIGGVSLLIGIVFGFMSLVKIIWMIPPFV